MKNGYRHETGAYAPETAVGTGAVEPLVDEVEAATKVPTVDESTAGQGKNKPRQAEASDLKVSGEDVGDSGTGTVLSNGEDFETREVAADPHADDADANTTEDPEVPQAVKPSRKSKSST